MLIETADLEVLLGDDALRIIDCNIVMTPKTEGGYTIASGLPDWQAAHIPDSTYIDIQTELSAERDDLRFMMPGPQVFQQTMQAHGIGNNHSVVVYSRGGNFWATRLYLMLKEYGFGSVTVLNGGWDKWLAEARPTTSETPGWASTHFTCDAPAGIFVDKNAVLAAIDDPTTCIINALSPAIHHGQTFNPPYGRPGHIKGSENVYCMDLIDRDTNCFVDEAKIKQAFAHSGALEAERVIVYCGGGISATTDAFALQLIGRKNVFVYDGSLSEWGNDPSLPMET